MRIFLIVTNTTRKSLIFFSNTFKMMTLDEVIRNAKNNELDDVFVVNGKYGEYIRSIPNSISQDNLDSKSITAQDILDYANSNRHFLSTDAISIYVAHYIASIQSTGSPYIKTEEGHMAYQDQVKKIISAHRVLFKDVGTEFGVDHYLLAAVVIDELVRLAPFEFVTDETIVDVLGRDTSVGLAQIKLGTANELIKNGYYNPNVNDKRLPIIGRMDGEGRRYLFKYVVLPEHNIHFQAGVIKNIIDFWKQSIDLTSRPEIIGTLYSQGLGKPNKDPKSIPRGDQIAGEFYEYAKKWLK